ncbi:hypothetical protein MN116_000944 [Schistosoma mekongi]|uniref:Uncharacterized protein n=1 Tax=Schistosoma mekongi TaxID=38744 RepID=A0AAE2D8W8_SCHME|nr:hypothetical protein MN116_000944 [Schistosoma mekongi]
MNKCKTNKQISFSSNCKHNVPESSLPIQLDHVYQHYYELMKLYTTPENYCQREYLNNPITTNCFDFPNPLTTTNTIISNSNNSAELSNSINLFCCLHSKKINYLINCCSSPRFQRIMYHFVLTLLGISIVLSIILLLLGIFLNYRACLTTGCILGIASFGALLHGCLRHRTLPNSPIPIILSTSCMHPIRNKIPISMNKISGKFSHEQQQQQLQQLPCDCSMNPLIKRQYLAPTGYYYINNHRNSNHNKNTEVLIGRNFDNLGQSYHLQTVNDMHSGHLKNKGNIECSSDTSSSSSSSPSSLALSMTSPLSPIVTKMTTASTQKYKNNNGNNDQTTHVHKHLLKYGDNYKLTNSINYKICHSTLSSSYPIDYEHQEDFINNPQSSNWNNESQIYTPRSCLCSSSALSHSIETSNIQQSHIINSDLCDLDCSPEINIESHDQCKHINIWQRNQSTYSENNHSNLFTTDNDKQSNQYYSNHSLVIDKSNHINHINDQWKHIHSFMIYPKLSNKILLRNYLNLLNRLYHHVDHSQQLSYTNEHFNSEYGNDIFGPHAWQSWKNWVD